MGQASARRASYILAAALLAVLAQPAPANAASPQGRTWAQVARLPDWSGLWFAELRANTSLSEGAAAPPLLPEAQARYEAWQAEKARGAHAQRRTANCLPPGMPQIMMQPYPVEFLFNPGLVVVAIETYSQSRHIFTDGRRHPADPDLTFQGHSIGHWEGQTLVVDSVGFSPLTEISLGVPHSDQMRITERVSLTDPGHLRIVQTITDPKVLSRPWTLVWPYRRARDDIREFVCEQNNHDYADPGGKAEQRLND